MSFVLLKQLVGILVHMHLLCERQSETGLINTKCSINSVQNVMCNIFIIRCVKIFTIMVKQYVNYQVRMYDGHFWLMVLLSCQF